MVLLDATTGDVRHRVAGVVWPGTILVDASGAHAFIPGTRADHQGNAIGMLDLRTGALHVLPPVGVTSGSLTNAVLDDRTQHLFVANDGTEPNLLFSTKPTIGMLDLRTGRLLRSIPAATQSLALDSDGGRLYAVDGAQTLSIIDTHSGRILRAINVGNYMAQVVLVDTSDNRLFTAGYQRGVTAFDLRSAEVMWTFPEFGVGDLAVDPVAGHLFVPAEDGISILNARTGAPETFVSPGDIEQFAGPVLSHASSEP